MSDVPSPAAPAPAGSDDPGWYVVRCRPRQEARALEHLERQGFVAFAPQCRITRRQGTVRRPVVEPLFPGYAFVRLSPTRGDWGVLRSTRGVQYLVRFGLNTPRLPQAAIDQLRALDGVDLDRGPPRLAVGMRVRVSEGPFVGLEGVFTQRDGEARAQVLLDCMQRLVRVTLAETQLEPAH